MPIYEKPTKILMHEFACERLKPGDIFTRQDAVAWFSERYPKIKPATVRMHVDGMSVNATTERKHHPSIRRGSDHDLFFKLDRTHFRLWASDSDPAPIYREDLLQPNIEEYAPLDEDIETEGGRRFAFERDLRNYLQKNLSSIETGLRIYDEEEILGIEFPADGRYIDILAVDKEDNYVVIELKVSRGYERAIGQILRYMAWVKVNLASGRRVRGVIVASQISEDLKLAASLIPDLRLVEYQISFSLQPVL